MLDVAIGSVDFNGVGIPERAYIEMFGHEIKIGVCCIHFQLEEGRVCVCKCHIRKIVLK